MAKSFYFYDLETSGTDPRWDRIVQFAGLRTDLDLNPLGDEYETFVQLPDDVLPNPDAALVTGITPQQTHERGISEWTALQAILEHLAAPGTCTAGYNSLRFDDEFIRYACYRNFRDPYAREWQHGNSRWDLIDLVRATGALRRDGIQWPVDEEGLPVYKLEVLTAANGIEHGNAHDALSDVRATAALARLLKTHQPRLFEYYFNARFKKAPKALLEPYGARICVHVSGMYPRARFGTAPVMSICRHPVNANAIVVADLAEDIEMLIDASEDELRQALFTAGHPARPPLKEVRINRCPFVADASVLTEENIERIGLDMKLVEKRARRLRQPAVAAKISRVFHQNPRPKASDPDAALYDGFLQDEDRSRCDSVVARVNAGDFPDRMDFRDKRLTALLPRLKARLHPELLSDDERADWFAFVREKLNAPQADWLTLPVLRQRISELEGAGADSAVLGALRTHAERLEQRYIN